MSREAIKKAVGYRAAELIEAGMLVGLGTGSTVFFFIQRLIERCQEGLKIQVVASSIQSLILAKQGKIPLADLENISQLDITVDGADEIDPQKRMIKGGGGAHVREKLVACMSKEMVVIVDESKCVEQLGKCKLPVEILLFGAEATLHRIRNLGYNGVFRKSEEGSLFITDNGNYIVDIHFEKPRQNPEEDHEAILHVPGVVDTGFFFHMAGRVITGFFDGQILIRS
ncbi:MAG: ribose 5-phosphate isomerase A [Chlamydiales bacterium]|nr:ribose 5-phosphate isomerase A [Chlamydiales bacterium]